MLKRNARGCCLASGRQTSTRLDWSCTPAPSHVTKAVTAEAGGVIREDDEVAVAPAAVRAGLRVRSGFTPTDFGLSRADALTLYLR